MKLSPLKNLLLLDAAILIVVGGLFIVAPNQISAFFKFSNVPLAVNYLIGLWGCVLITLGAAYVIAATNPVRHRLWIQIGIARGALETILGLTYLSIGAVTFAQAGFGTIAAAVMTLAYLLLYPRRPRLDPAAPAPPNPPAP